MLLYAPVLLSLASHAVAQDPADDQGYVIAYNGSLHGSYVSGKAAMQKSCGTAGAYYFSGLNDTIVRIGPPAPGDKNPFFFSLNHAGSNPYGMWTADALYNLQVVSAWEYDNTDDPEDFINMHKSTLSVVNTGPGLGHNNELPYYSLIGGIDSVNTSVGYWNGFNFQIPGNYSDVDWHSQCQNLSETSVDWAHLKNLTYVIKFTNVSADATFSVTTNESTIVTFVFSGERSDLLHEHGWNFDENSTSPISLAGPKAHDVPSFTFINGSAIPKPKEIVSTNNGSQNRTNGAKEDAAVRLVVSYIPLTILGCVSLFWAMF